MKTSWQRTLIVIGAIGVVIVVVAAFYAATPHEPEYEGKPLSTWLKQYDQPESREAEREAKAALRSIGTNAIPWLLEDLRTDSPPDWWLGFCGYLDDWTGLDLTPEPADAKRSRAAGGVVALGDKAQHAIPGLADCLSHPEPMVRFRAANTLGNLGWVWSSRDQSGFDAPIDSITNAIPPLIQCMNARSRASEMAASALGRIRQWPAEVIPELEAFLKEELKRATTDWSGATRAITAIGHFAEHFDEEAGRAAPLLGDLTDHPQSEIRDAARHALQKIDPDIDQE